MPHAASVSGEQTQGDRKMRATSTFVIVYDRRDISFDPNSSQPPVVRHGARPLGHVERSSGWIQASRLTPDDREELAGILTTAKHLIKV